LDSRERTLLVLNHEEADRVPIDFWASSGTRQRITAGWSVSYDEFLDAQDVDLRYLPGPRYTGPRRVNPHGSDVTDIWGVVRKRVEIKLVDGTGEHSEHYYDVVRSPLENCRTCEEILSYPSWPSPDWYDYGEIEAQCETIRSQKRIAVFMGDRLNRIAQLKPAMYLRGSERMLLDLFDNPEMARAILQKITSFYLEYGTRILESAHGKIDILCTGDDFGSQNNTFISPSMWEDFLRPGFERYIGLGKAYGAAVMHHTCGAVSDLIPQMTSCGLDILQSIQPEASGMDPRVIKQKFGDRLSFHGGVSIQKVVPRGTGADIRKHVQQLFQAMAPGGGFIACTSHNIQADTPLTNIESLLQAYRDFGRYGSIF
jgi:uroporphyrinogen decarboxylase